MALLNAPHQILVISGNVLPDTGYEGTTFFKTSIPNFGWWYCGLDNVWVPGTFTGPLIGDVTGTQGVTVVESVGGSAAADVHSAELTANAATDVNTPLTVVKRDDSGGFSAGTISVGGVVVALPVYTINADAVTGGLPVGAFYRTGGDPDVVCVVH